MIIKKDIKDITILTIGQRLSQERKRLGLTVENIAKQLCLKTSTVNEIEQDIQPYGVEPTFLRGYIRLYARFVGISEHDINILLNTKSIVDISSVPLNDKKSFIFIKKYKQYKFYLIKIILFIIFFFIIGIHLLKYYNKESNVLLFMINNYEKISLKYNKSLVYFFNSFFSFKNKNLKDIFGYNNLLDEKITKKNLDNKLINSITEITDNIQYIKDNDMLYENSNLLNLKFLGTCWLEVRDANKKILFSGIKNNGDKLELYGIIPYSLNIGAPINVIIFFQNKMINFNHSINTNRSIRIIIP
ncbi:RodZ domain-containing protein [Candidatus Providencia siddallii]|uniref:Cytoskeleton protein RodZ n=1 Tax=Candidatus Providencia siddallii TaxID=1715285 RepID=A0ABM9NP95_9GAMM